MFLYFLYALEQFLESLLLLFKQFLPVKLLFGRESVTLHSSFQQLDSEFPGVCVCVCFFWLVYFEFSLSSTDSVLPFSTEKSQHF